MTIIAKGTITVNSTTSWYVRVNKHQDGVPLQGGCAACSSPSRERALSRPPTQKHNTEGAEMEQDSMAPVPKIDCPAYWPTGAHYASLRATDDRAKENTFLRGGKRGSRGERAVDR